MSRISLEVKVLMCMITIQPLEHLKGGEKKETRLTFMIVDDFKTDEGEKIYLEQVYNMAILLFI